MFGFFTDVFFCAEVLSPTECTECTEFFLNLPQMAQISLIFFSFFLMRCFDCVKRRVTDDHRLLLATFVGFLDRLLYFVVKCYITNIQNFGANVKCFGDFFLFFLGCGGMMRVAVWGMKKSCADWHSFWGLFEVVVEIVGDFLHEVDAVFAYDIVFGAGIDEVVDWDVEGDAGVEEVE